MGILRPGFTGFRREKLGGHGRQDLRRHLLRPDSIVNLVRIPFFEFANQLDLLLVPYCPDAKQMGDVDYSQSTNFHMMSDHLVGSLPHEDGAVDTANLDHVVGDETMPPLDQFQRGFAFPTPGIADQENTDPIDFHKTPWIVVRGAKMSRRTLKYAAGKLA